MEPYYQKSGITIYNGDCLEIMDQFRDKSFNLLLTDPPYGIGTEFDNYEDTEENWFKLMNSALPKMIRVAKMCILPCCRFKYLEWIYQNYPPDWLICWYKGAGWQRSFIGFNDWEPLLVYGKTSKGMYMHDFFGTRPSPPRGTFNHPCPKPIQWADWLIQKATKKADIIFDPFMGSGTTMVSAKQLGRKAVGIEISEKYCQIAVERLKQVQIKLF